MLYVIPIPCTRRIQSRAATAASYYTTTTRGKNQSMCQCIPATTVRIIYAYEFRELERREGFPDMFRHCTPTEYVRLYIDQVFRGGSPYLEGSVPARSSGYP